MSNSSHAFCPLACFYIFTFYLAKMVLNTLPAQVNNVTLYKECFIIDSPGVKDKTGDV